MQTLSYVALHLSTHTSRTALSLPPVLSRETVALRIRPQTPEHRRLGRIRINFEQLVEWQEGSWPTRSD